MFTNYRPSISIILMTLNGMPEFEHTLHRVLNQDYLGPMEIIHIDSGSTDATLDLMASCSIDTHHIVPSEFHHSRTRNFGANLAQHEILVFLSQDAIPVHKSWLRRLVAPFQDSKVGGVYGRQIPPEGTNLRRIYSMECLYSLTPEIRDVSNIERPSLSLFRFSNANSAIRSSLFQKFQFNEDAFICEDQGMCRDILKAGFKIVYEPDASVIHGHERSLWGEFKWTVDNGISLKRMRIIGKSNLGSEFRYGFQRLSSELKHYTFKKKYGAVFMAIAVSIVQWLGVQIGKREEYLPIWFMMLVSPGLKREINITKKELTLHKIK